jgi:hypothetical protein
MRHRIGQREPIDGDGLEVLTVLRGPAQTKPACHEAVSPPGNSVDEEAVGVVPVAVFRPTGAPWPASS